VPFNHGHAPVLVVAARRPNDDHRLAHLRAFAAGPVDERTADLVIPAGKAPEFHDDRLRRFGPIELDSTAAIVVARVGHHFERAILGIGVMWTRTVNVAGANDCAGDTAIVSRSPTSARVAAASINQPAHH